MRYTESRLDKISKHMLEDIEKKTVDFNQLTTTRRWSRQSCREPNLLLNGSDGITLGWRPE